MDTLVDPAPISKAPFGHEVDVHRRAKRIEQKAKRSEAPKVCELVLPSPVLVLAAHAIQPLEN